MSLMAKDNGGDDIEYEVPPASNHIAICYMVADLGVHKSEYKGEITEARKVRIAFELCGDDVMKDGRPYSIALGFQGAETLSLGKKAHLRRHLEGWRGRAFTDEELSGFDVSNVLGKPAMVNIIHTHSKDGEKTYAKINAIAKLPKGISVPDRVNDLVKFSLDDYSPEVFNALPEWLQKKINISGVNQPQAQESENLAAWEKKEQEEKLIGETPDDEPLPEDFDDDIPF